MAFKFNWDIEDSLDDELDSNADDITPPASRARGAEGAVISSPSSPSASSQRRYDYTLPAAGLESSIAQLQIQKDDALLSPSSALTTTSTKRLPCTEISLDELLDCLPPVLSYSPVEITLTSRAEKSSHAPGGHSARLLRRDLFDARFQLANRDDDSDDEGSSFGNMIPRNLSPPKGILGGLGAANGDSSGSADLVKGVYEGGLKTWEASLDLVDTLAQLGYHTSKHATATEGIPLQGKRILEVGCGTAVPTLYLLDILFRQLLAKERQAGVAGGEPTVLDATPPLTVVHLQDYNAEVLQYITFCNVLLAYWNAVRGMSSHASVHVTSGGATASTSSGPEDGEHDDSDDTITDGDIEYTMVDSDDDDEEDGDDDVDQQDDDEEEEIIEDGDTQHTRSSRFREGQEEKQKREKRKKAKASRKSGGHGDEDGEPASVDELDVDDALIDSFLEFIKRHRIELRFFAGAWETFPAAAAKPSSSSTLSSSSSPTSLAINLETIPITPREQREQLEQKPYDIILTSETVYDLESLPSLVRLLRRSATSPAQTSSITTRRSHSLSAATTAMNRVDGLGKQEEEHPEQLTLVACKRVYFGVGGGEWAFKQEIGDSAQVENIWNSHTGVERTVMRVRFS